MKTDVSAIPGLFGASEQIAFRSFLEKERRQQEKKHGRYGALFVDTSALYRAWTKGRRYERWGAPKADP